MRVGPFRVADRRSEWYGRSVYLIISRERIEKIEPTSEEAILWVSSGWVDLLAWTNQPFLPATETLEELAIRARRGGFTTVGISGWQGWYEPKSLAEVKELTPELPASFLLFSAWSSPKGDIAALESLYIEGGFGWVLPPEWPVPWQTLRRALPYLRHLGGPVFLLPFWEAIGGEKGVAETSVLSLSGWEGFPPYVETVGIHAVAALWQAYGGKVIIGPITTRAGLKVLGQYGIPAFTGISYLVADASYLLDYDARWKLHPPLRASEDKAALVRALIQSRYMCIASYDYMAPLEEKMREWTSAAVGQSTLAVVAPLLYYALEREYPLEKKELPALLAEILSERPRRLLGLPHPVLDEGHPLELTLFELLQESYVLPYPWEAFSSNLRVVGTIRSLDDLDNLEIKMS
ncbi:MAG: hypothetical protein RMJ66_05300 [Bacteroidia bacterium]|nr:hypothetical protein [Bacteroidia bacterium]MDW8134464.1 hypothetical protein [Bacteroidia bacterium]